jgi:hypothetical protein
MTGIPHIHPPGELDAPAWTLDRLLDHLDRGHGMMFGRVGKDVPQMAAIHAGEHPVAAGIVPPSQHQESDSR